jgi:hypothetical protein
MPARAVPARHWRRYGNRPLPSGEEVLDEPVRAFRRGSCAWCARCGKERLICETYLLHGDMLIRDIIFRMRRDGCEI